jgi:hypothetical protein
MSIFTNQSTDQSSPSGGKSFISSSNVTTSAGTINLYGVAGSVATQMGFNATPAIGNNTPAGRLTIPANGAWYFVGRIVCAKSDLSNFTDAAGGPVAFDVAFACARGTLASSTTLIGTPTITKVFGSNNSAITASNITITADTTNGEIDINVTGETGISYTFSAMLTFARTGDY